MPLATPKYSKLVGMKGRVQGRKGGPARILFLWHAAADPNNRALLEEAVRHRGLDILVMATRVLDDRLARWSLSHAVERRGPGSRLRVVPSRALFPRSLGYHCYLAFPPRLAAFQPDLVHVHAETASIAAFRAAALRPLLAPRAKLVVHPYQNIRVDYRWPWPLLEKFVIRRADAAVAGNPGAARVLAGRGFRGPLRVIRTLGADPAVFRPRSGGPVRRSLPPGGPVIGWSGRMFRGKGLHVLLEACSRIRRPFRILAVGDGPRRYELEAQAARLGLAEQIKWAGAVPVSRMPDYYAAMDIFAAPTIDRPPDMPEWKEQCPRAHVEAMLSGLPIAASDGGENAWTIGNAGIIVPRGNPAALARALGRLLASPRLRKSLGRRARARALANFTWKRNAAALVSFWRELLE